MSTRESQAPKQINMTDPPVQPKVFHAGEKYIGQPYLVLTQDDIRLSAGLNNGLTVDNLFGTTIQGPISLSETPDHISVGGGYWRINPLVMTCIGSSAATPVPWLVKSEPNLVKQKKNLGGILDSFNRSGLGGVI